MTISERRTVRGACPHDCPDTCAMLIDVDGDRALGVRGDPDHPFTDGWLCAKVRPYLDRVYHPDRLQYPMRRRGPKGSDQWERISWSEAIDEISLRWKQIIEQYGASAILPYSYSGTLGLVQLIAANERLWRRMGASGLERSICDAAAVAAVKMTVGGRFAPDARDLAHSRFILIWGHNPASTSPHTVPFIRRAQRSGAKVVVIDPRRTRTARSADLHLQPRPATDGALALGLMHVIFAENLHDAHWLDQHTVGWTKLRDRSERYPPERVAGITGIDAEQIKKLAREYATSSPAILKFSDGVQRHGNGGQTARALCCLPALTGQYGKRGGGLFYSTSDYVQWNAEAVSHASECPPVPRIVNMNRLGRALTEEIQDPPIMSLFVFCANPVTASPNSKLTVQGLLREDLFTVVHELFMTDTARYADIVLPATSQLEQIDLHRGYGHRFLQYNDQSIPPLAECRSNWDVMRELAAAMGYEEPWLQMPAEDVIREIWEATQPESPTLAGLELDDLIDKGTLPLSMPDGREVPFSDGRFPTPSGRVELYCEAAMARGLDPLPEYSPPAEFDDASAAGRLVLISGAAHHYVTSSMANIPVLQRKEGVPSLEINPMDAERRGICNGEDVIVSNDRGSCQLRAVVTDDVARGVAVALKGHWAQNSPDGRNINWTTPDALADLAGQSTFHSNLVDVRPCH